MNVINNDYIQLDMPNILFERRKIDQDTTVLITADNTTVAPFILPLILRLARARPQWNFVAVRRYMVSDSMYNVNRFAVSVGNTHLGEIWKSTGNNGSEVGINNDRMSTSRMRGNASNTKDLKKAFKLVTQNFHVLTVAEDISNTLKVAATTVSSLCSESHWAFHSKYNVLKHFLETYTINNWDHVKQMAIEAGVNATSLDGMLEAYKSRLATEALNKAMDDNSGTTVLIRDEKYVLVTGGVTSILDTDQLPLHIKRSVGILKMVENRTCVEGHGVRLEKDKFFVSSKEGVTPVSVDRCITSGVLHL